MLEAKLNTIKMVFGKLIRKLKFSLGVAFENLP
jgi:hypothetical protein